MLSGGVREEEKVEEEIGGGRYLELDQVAAGLQLDVYFLRPKAFHEAGREGRVARLRELAKPVRLPAFGLGILLVELGLRGEPCTVILSSVVAICEAVDSPQGGPHPLKWHSPL